MQICRICMNSDVKMCLLDAYHIYLYEQMTGTAFNPHDVLPKYVCWECGHYMSKYVAFRSKAMRSLCILTEILNKTGLITQTICAPYKLESNLTITDTYIDVSIDPDYETEPSSSSELKVDNKSIENNIYNVFNANLELTEDLAQNNEEILVSENLVPSPVNHITIENIEIIDSYTDDRPEKLSGGNKVKNDGDTKISNKTKAKCKTKPISKTGQVRRKRKTVTKEKKINNNKSLMDEIDRDIINVTELTIDEQIYEIQNRKESDGYKSSSFKCEKCFKGFLDNDRLERHMVKHSHTMGALECPLCRTRFSIQKNLNQHMKNHMYKFTCKLCNFTAKVLNAVVRHQDHHKGRVSQYSCPHCSEVYTHVSSYLSHLRIKHPSNVICQYCGHSFINENGLIFHKKVVHRFDQTGIPEDGPHCERCDIRFASQTALETHKQLSDKHRDERNSPTTQRQRTEAKRRAKHSSKPFADGPAPCEQCGEHMPNPRAYWTHFRREHKGENRTIYHGKKAYKHMCEVCGKVFASPAALNYHKYAHSSEKQFKCEYCGKSFQLEVYLKIHQKDHCRGRTEKTGYPCPECGKVFSSRQNKRRHMVSHTGIKAFQCDFCDKKFSLMELKKSHTEFVHKKKPWPKRNRGARKRPDGQNEAV